MMTGDYQQPTSGARNPSQAEVDSLAINRKSTTHRLPFILTWQPRSGGSNQLAYHHQ